MSLWFAFKLVSLIHWKQRLRPILSSLAVVICFQISIFDPLETASMIWLLPYTRLWFAFKLVSLIHWKQHELGDLIKDWVVICFQISIFDPLETAPFTYTGVPVLLWFAFKLVSLIHWKQHPSFVMLDEARCDLLSN